MGPRRYTPRRPVAEIDFTGKEIITTTAIKDTTVKKRTGENQLKSTSASSVSSLQSSPAQFLFSRKRKFTPDMEKEYIKMMQLELELGKKDLEIRQIELRTREIEAKYKLDQAKFKLEQIKFESELLEQQRKRLDSERRMEMINDVMKLRGYGLNREDVQYAMPSIYPELLNLFPQKTSDEPSK